jgi:hypothetical protein
MRRQRPALVVVGAVACLAACGGPLKVNGPKLSGAAADACSAFVDALPDSVGDQERRDVEGGYAAAYGDPPIVVTCGVPRPDELMTNCMTVNGVDWYLTGETDAVAITVGRDPNVEVRIPAAYGSSAAALVDVTSAVKQKTKAGEGCPSAP